MGSRVGASPHSGGDYVAGGLAGCGIGIACETAKARFQCHQFHLIGGPTTTGRKPSIQRRESYHDSAESYITSLPLLREDRLCTEAPHRANRTRNLAYYNATHAPRTGPADEYDRNHAQGYGAGARTIDGEHRERYAIRNLSATCGQAYAGISFYRLKVFKFSFQSLDNFKQYPDQNITYTPISSRYYGSLFRVVSA